MNGSLVFLIAIAIGNLNIQIAQFSEAGVSKWSGSKLDLSMMEPLIMSVLGILVGGLVVAMYLPIFQMGSVV